VSATNRVLGTIPLPSDYGLKLLNKQCSRLSSRYGHLQPWTLEKVLESFKGARKQRYQVAYNDLNLKPLCHDDARIKSFVKAEKMNPFDKNNPDPRMIQARNPRYNLVIAKYLRPVEHIIYNLQHRGRRCVAKGLNQFDRAKLIIDKFSDFIDPVCFSLDCSRWDKHVSADVLKIEHRFYRRLIPNHPEFDMLLDLQINNKCRTTTGIKYTTYGGRMSGDINTALGNCLLMVLMVHASMTALGLSDYDFIDDGDDCLVFVERKYFDIIQNYLPKIYLSFGQELKIENVAFSWSDIVFCQSRIAYGARGYIMVRDWRKVLSQSCSGTKHWLIPTLIRPLMRLIGECELALNMGVPILQSYSLALIRNGGHKRAKLGNLDSGLLYRVSLEGNPDEILGKAKPCTITPYARNLFDVVFRVPIWQQLAIESILDKWTLDDVKHVDLPMEWDSSWNDYRSLLVHNPEIF